MTIADPQRAYIILWWHLTNQRASAATAKRKLTELFTGPKKPTKQWYVRLLCLLYIFLFLFLFFLFFSSYRYSRVACFWWTSWTCW
jgi:hypothetical protein